MENKLSIGKGTVWLENIHPKTFFRWLLLLCNHPSVTFRFLEQEVPLRHSLWWIHHPLIVAQYRFLKARAVGVVATRRLALHGVVGRMMVLKITVSTGLSGLSPSVVELETGNEGEAGLLEGISDL